MTTETQIKNHHYNCSTWTMEQHERPAVEACTECQNIKGDEDAGRLREINADLLAALKACCEFLEANYDLDESDWHPVEDRHKQALAAIQKAEQS